MPAGPDVDPPPPDGALKPSVDETIHHSAPASPTTRLNEVKKWKLHHQSLQSARQKMQADDQDLSVNTLLPPQLTLTTPEETQPMLSIPRSLSEDQSHLGRPRSPAISLSREGLASLAEEGSAQPSRRERMAQSTGRFAQSSKRAFLLTMAQLGALVISLFSYILPFYETEGHLCGHLNLL